jgi:hypothetical protein
MRRGARVAEARSLDARSLRTALKNRDVQLEAAIERIKELEALLARCVACPVRVCLWVVVWICWM